MMTNQQQDSERLNKLLSVLKEYKSQIPVRELRNALELHPVTLQDVEPYVKFQDDRYARNPIYRNPYFEMLCLCWKSGQRSPIHDHLGSNCCVRIMEGSMTATDFVRAASGFIKATRSFEMSPYTVSALESADIHQMSNLQESGKHVITLHVYTYPQQTINVYNLVDNKITSLTFPQWQSEP